MKAPRGYKAGQPVERRVEYQRGGAEKLLVKIEAAPVREIVEKIENAENVAAEAKQYLLDRIAEETKAWDKM
jgi:CRISPR/Cas system-associated protein Csx1